MMTDPATLLSNISSAADIYGAAACSLNSSSSTGVQESTAVGQGNGTSTTSGQASPSGDKVTLSEEVLQLAAQQTGSAENVESENQEANTASGDFSEEELKLIEELSQRDKEVRTHEQSHKNVAGQYAGAISYSYESGPDGVRYATSGEVPIDMSEENTPEETLQKMRVVRKAALAPAEPSGADKRIAAEASAMAAEASQEIQQSKTAEIQGNDDEDSGSIDSDISSQRTGTENSSDQSSSNSDQDQSDSSSVSRQPISIKA